MLTPQCIIEPEADSCGGAYVPARRSSPEDRFWRKAAVRRNVRSWGQGGHHLWSTHVRFDPLRTERPRDRCYQMFFCIERAHAENALIEASFGCPDRCTR